MIRKCPWRNIPMKCQPVLHSHPLLFSWGSTHRHSGADRDHSSNSFQQIFTVFAVFSRVYLFSLSTPSFSTNPVLSKIFFLFSPIQLVFYNFLVSLFFSVSSKSIGVKAGQSLPRHQNYFLHLMVILRFPSQPKFWHQNGRRGGGDQNR